MKCDACHKEQSKSSMKTLTFEGSDGSEKLVGTLCRACYERAIKHIENGDSFSVLNMLREANGQYDFVCELCGKKTAGESITLELPDREMPIESCCQLSICPGCLDKIWIAVDNIAENKQ